MTEALTRGSCRPTSGWDLPTPTDHRTRLSTNQVVALFASSSVSFHLAVGATLEDLADCLDRHSERHIGLPTAVYLKVDVAEPPVSVLEPGN
jgi:hypothetical protein